MFGRPPGQDAFRPGTAGLLGEMLLCSLLWAPAFLLMKRIGTDISPLGVTALRDLMGGGLIALWFLFIGNRLLPRGREWLDWTVLSIFQVIVPTTLTVYALTEITTSLASLIQSSTPLIVAFLAHFAFASERMTWRRASGIALGVCGVLFLLGPDAFAFQSSDRSFPGTLAMAGVPLCYAIGNLYVRSIPQAQPTRLAYGQMVFSGIPALALAVLVDGPPTFHSVPTHAGDLIVLSLVATAIPLVMFMRILRKAGPTIGTMVGYLIPLWTILLGSLFFEERLAGREILGGVLLLAGLVIVSSTRPPPTTNE